MMPADNGFDANSLLNMLKGLNKSRDERYAPFDETIRLKHSMSIIAEFMMGEMKKVAPADYADHLMADLEKEYGEDELLSDIIGRLNAADGKKSPIFDLVSTEECEELNRRTVLLHLKHMTAYAQELNDRVASSKSTQFN